MSLDLTMDCSAQPPLMSEMAVRSDDENSVIRRVMGCGSWMVPSVLDEGLPVSPQSGCRGRGASGLLACDEGGKILAGSSLTPETVSGVPSAMIVPPATRPRSMIQSALRMIEVR